MRIYFQFVLIILTTSAAFCTSQDSLSSKTNNYQLSFDVGYGFYYFNDQKSLITTPQSPLPNYLSVEFNKNRIGFAFTFGQYVWRTPENIPREPRPYGELWVRFARLGIVSFKYNLVDKKGFKLRPIIGLGYQVNQDSKFRAFIDNVYTVKANDWKRAYFGTIGLESSFKLYKGLSLKSDIDFSYIIHENRPLSHLFPSYKSFGFMNIGLRYTIGLR